MMEGIDKNADGDTTDIGEQITVIDTTADTSWMPIGDNSTNNDTTRFTGIFEGNNHTIANLWVNISSSTNDIYAGLFGVTGGMSGHSQCGDYFWLNSCLFFYCCGSFFFWRSGGSFYCDFDNYTIALLVDQVGFLLPLLLVLVLVV